MQINSVNNYSYFKSYATPNFKQGLTRDIVNHVKNMPSDEYQRITDRLWNNYGIIADAGKSNAVAYCIEKTAEIMHKAGFKLPQIVAYSPTTIPTDIGTFNPDVRLSNNSNHFGIVTINSRYNEFLDLEVLNKKEDSIKHPYSGTPHNFLHTYLHEFSHAAHYGNIVNAHNKILCDDAFSDLTNYKPYSMIYEPITYLMERIGSLFSSEFIPKIFESDERLFFTNDLCEYFAEKNTKTLSAQLGENLNPENIIDNFINDYNECLSYKDTISENKELNKLFLMRISQIFSKYTKDELDTKICNIFNNIIKYFDVNIWNGNIKNIKKMTNFFDHY